MSQRILSWLTLLAGFPAALSAQIDYRNLDDDRPLSVEDAYPIEHFAFELLLPYGFERSGGHSLHAVTPELAWGALSNLHLGMKLPIALSADGPSESGIAGARGFLVYNLSTESPLLPAVGARADLSLPVGALGGRGARGAVSLLLTRSFGAFRLHGNAGIATADPDRAATVEPLPRWRTGVALDRTFFRQSLLLGAEVTARQLHDGAATETVLGVGARWQWRPTAVLDLGVHRRLSAQGPEVAVTVGVSHAFGIRALLPRRVPIREVTP